MTSWKTTLGGILSAIGVGLSQSDNPTFRGFGALLSAAGPLLIGLAARDQNVTSEQAGAK